MWRSLTGLRSASSSKLSPRLFSTNGRAAPKKKIGMKELVKEYGWTATGTYFALSLVDLPLSYMLVHNAGQERLEGWEISSRQSIGVNADRENTYVHKANKGGKSLFWAEFGVAYIIHKASIVIRVPITVALTPRIASRLGKWGFRVNRAVPTINKEKMAYQVAKTAENSNSAAIKKAADIMSKDTKIPQDKILDEAAKTLKSSTTASARKARETSDDVRSHVNNQIKK